MLGETCLGIILRGEHGELVFMALRTYVFKKAFEPRRWAGSSVIQDIRRVGFAQITLRARPTLTTFKTLKTDRGIGFVTGSLIALLGRIRESGIPRMEAECRTSGRSAPTEGAAAR